MKHLLTTALVGTLALAAPFAPTAAQAEEVNVLMFGMPFTNGLLELTDEFEAETGITVNMDVVGQDVFESRITLSFTGGTGDIDVVHTPVIQVQKWIQAGWLQPMTDLGVRGNDIRHSGGAFGRVLSEWRTMGAAVLRWRWLDELPQRTILEEAGLDVPQTWAELLEIAPQVHNDEHAAIALRAVPGQGFNMFIFPMVMRAYGGTFFADYENGDLTPAINSA